MFLRQTDRQAGRLSHPLLVSVHDDQVGFVSVAPVSGIVPAQSRLTEVITAGAKRSPIKRTAAVPNRT